MSSPENVFAYFNDIGWLCMVTLFLASIVTLIIYLVQYFFDDHHHTGNSEQNNAASDEANALLDWALSLKSWKTQWRRAWFSALNDESKLLEGSILLNFEEDGVQVSELSVGNISSFKTSPGRKNACCQVVGDKLQFSLSATFTSSPQAPPLRYSVKMSPLHLQLDVQLKEAKDEIHITWGVSQLDAWDLQLTPSFTQADAAGPSVEAVRDKLRQVLCRARPSVTLSGQPAQSAQEIRNKTSQVTSPPKPPRAHEWKLLVKNIRVTCKQEDGAAGSLNPQCVLQLDDPPQKFSSAVLKDTSSPSWDQPFVFELSGRSKELNIQVLDTGKAQESCLVGQVTVPFDLVKKQPKGQQTFALMTKDHVTGSLSTEFTYLEPSEVRTWQAPTPAPVKKVEMDRTVMPCGTVVTTVTAVTSRPGRPLPPGPNTESVKPPPKTKLSERRVSEQPSMLGAKVSKALSSSDTELMMLNGTDPVAEAAIRQLHESAKQKMKSPVKKSTIIISGVAKTPLSQDEEMAMMAGYAAAMDASMSGASGNVTMETASSGTEVETGSAEPSDPVEVPGEAGPAEDWESQAGEDPDADKTSLSLCMSETSSKKGKGSFLHKSAKLFFRRRHQRKDPGMSQSHNDLVYLENPEVPAMGERERRTATFRRIINRKLLPKSKSKANGSAGEQHA
ncbi:C2 domain-containing protein 2 isoform X2 [Chanos chanos]|uniref:C2 domain-containing protein 2 isoform X2 n=1 Tax=Chanos chanos TaxID=29144 RepID=A0A6J2WWE5_CHACN|nr:C2 domain-containing protein 2 isoform X2 [Chanos chanos]